MIKKKGVIIHVVIQVLIIISTILTIIHIINSSDNQTLNIIKKPPIEESLDTYDCQFESESNVYDFNGNIKGKSGIVPCTTCNQYIWKKDNLCGTFEYDNTYLGNLSDDDVRLCTESPLTSGECPFS